MYHVKLEQFEGPFSLLVQLIDEKKLSINEISLSNVTEQYLGHLESIEESHPAELADFLVVASKLLLIKSRTLLPDLEVEEEEGDLEGQLKLYKAFVKASELVDARLDNAATLVARPMPKLADLRPLFSPHESLSLEVLHDTMIEVLKELKPVVTLPEKLIERAVSMEEKIEHIRAHIEKKATVHFSHVLKAAQSRTEVVVSFLALLELVKQRHVHVSQPKAFHDIVIKRV